MHVAYIKTVAFWENTLQDTVHQKIILNHLTATHDTDKKAAVKVRTTKTPLDTHGVGVSELQHIVKHKTDTFRSMCRDMHIQLYN